MTPAQKKLQELEACMFGTLVSRDPSEGVNRAKRTADGWRHGVNRPFELDGVVYGHDIDAAIKVPRGSDGVTAMYEALSQDLAALIEAEIEALPPIERAAQDDAPKPNACCNVAGNLVRRPDLERPDLSVNVCRICRCRHFELTVDPANIFARGESIE